MRATSVLANLIHPAQDIKSCQVAEPRPTSDLPRDFVFSYHFRKIIGFGPLSNNSLNK